MWIIPTSPAIFTLSLHDALPISYAQGLHGRYDASDGQRIGEASVLGPVLDEDLAHTCDAAVDGEVGGQALHTFLIEEVERSEEHTSELQSRGHLVCRLLLEQTKRRKAQRT